MRRFDKIKNMQKANILVESRYLKSKGVLQEGIIKLSQDEIKQLINLIPIFKKAIKRGEYNRAIDSPIQYYTADGIKAHAYPYVYNSNNGSSAHYITKNPNDHNDNWVGVNANFFNLAYLGVPESIFTILTGQNPDEYLLSCLKHELIHAKDPSANHHHLNAPYDSKKAESYYGTWIEFPTMTGEFFEAIEQRTFEQLEKDSSQESIKKIFNIYNDILDFYSGKDKIFNKETAIWLGGGSGNAFQNFISKIIDIGEKLFGRITPSWSQRNLLYDFSFKISLIKQYNPEGYKEFQKDLYKQIEEYKDYIKIKYMGYKPKNY